jgi:hypothetical protein
MQTHVLPVQDVYPGMALANRLKKRIFEDRVMVIFVIENGLKKN